MPDIHPDGPPPPNSFVTDDHYSLSLTLRLTPSPESEHDSAELSPDADDEASPESPSTAAPQISSSIREEMSPEFYRGDEGGAGNTISSFGLPAAQAAANVSLPTASENDTTFVANNGAVTNPDVEGIPEALSMPKDLMPNEDAFEEEGLTTLERIFLLSRSEHAFHRSVRDAFSTTRRDL